MRKKVKGVVAAGDPLTAEAGAEILRAGGNAYDAAIAATWMSFVASSTITSAGGGGFLLAAPQKGKNILFDFFVQTPKIKKQDGKTDFYPVVVDFGDKTQEFHVGLASAATPGNVAGLFEIHRLLGSVPMKEIVQPAVEAARKGVKLHKQTKYQVDILEPILTASEEGRTMYTKGGKLAGLNDTVKMPHYADLLEYLAVDGPGEFYKGEVARHVVNACEMSGGHLTMDDFLGYEVILRDPLKITYRGYEVATTPPPNAGGPLIAFLLKLLENEVIPVDQYGRRQYLSWLTRGIMLTARAREERLESLIHDPDLIKHLMDPGYLRQMQEQLTNTINKPGNTTHVSVVDAELNIATVTTSVGEGCGYIIPGTDVMLNNMLGEEDLNKKGFHLWIPDKRISSMMAPTVISAGGQPVMGLGSGGSNRIRSAIVQAITNFLDFRLDYDEVVNNPRIHWENGHLDVEPGFDREEVEAVNLPDDNKVFYWSGQNMYFGGVHAVFIDEKGHLHGAGDRRRAGSVATA